MGVLSSWHTQLSHSLLGAPKVWNSAVRKQCEEFAKLVLLSNEDCLGSEFGSCDLIFASVESCLEGRAAFSRLSAVQVSVGREGAWGW